jgi:hypothetical protein
MMEMETSCNIDVTNKKRTIDEIIVIDDDEDEVEDVMVALPGTLHEAFFHRSDVNANVIILEDKSFKFSTLVTRQRVQNPNWHDMWSLFL